MQHEEHFDLTGRRFGQLTVLRLTQGYNSGSVWECRCDCGRVVSVTFRDLVYYHKKSCGCLKRGRDLAGQRFGRLTAEEKAPPDAQGNTRWVCLCDCGNRCTVLTSNLTRGHTTSCGCRRVGKFIGQRFGRLTVLEKTEEYAGRGERRVPLWKCRCDCGNTVLVQIDTLTSGTTQSCGCLNEAKLEKMHAAAGYVEGTQLSRIRHVPESSGSSSGVVGVYFDKRSGKWRAGLKFQGRQHYLGLFDTIKEAAAARKAAEREWFGTFLEEWDKKRT